jgi:lipopolysaccharide/colanic/teichoic acid biosynthesis glycosyltransferase
MTQRAAYEVWKRLFDLSLTIPAVVVLAPILLLLAAVVATDSRGPILYRGRRIGRWGRPFDVLKFRTMVPDAERRSTTTALNDPRITRVGGFLRRYKLDELPQLVNVIKGEMSLVGPRPEVEEHTREYTEAELTILAVLPGITDYSSIRFVDLSKALGQENAHEVFVTRIRPEKNRLRLQYVRNRSFVEDLRILVRTFAAIAGVRRQHT